MKPSMRYIRRMRICAVTWKGFQKENRSLRKRLEKYEKPDKNSNNSSTPPSKEKMKAEVIRRTKSLRKKSGLKPGGQPGHEAHNRNMTEKPNVVEDCMSGYCRECGRDLSDIAGELDYVSQVVDLPTLAPVVREYRHYKKTCTCGCCNRGYEPRKRGNQNFWQERQSRCDLPERGAVHTLRATGFFNGRGVFCPHEPKHHQEHCAGGHEEIQACHKAAGRHAEEITHCGLR